MPQTTNDDRLYTYRNGQKVYLTKEDDAFITRTKPEEIHNRGYGVGVEQVSSASTKVKVGKEDLDRDMAKMREDFVTHHSYQVAETESEFLITDRIMLTLKSDVSPEVINDLIAKYSLIIIEKYSDREYLLQLTDQTDMNPVKLVVAITEQEEGVLFVEHDLNQRMELMLNMPVDPTYLEQWHLHRNFSHPEFDSRSSSECEGAWNALGNFGDFDVVIGVTDDGCKLSHPDFDSPNKFANWGYLQGINLIDSNSVGANPGDMYISGANHGTSCCGVAAADVDSNLTVGAAPGCRLLPIKWESSGPSLFISDSKLMKVLMLVADKVDILSSSWGSSPSMMFSSNVVNKVTQLAITGGRRSKGIIFLWAAGNENCPIKYSGTLDIPYSNGRDQSGNWIGVETSKVFNHNLVDIPGVMHVAALASHAQRSHYSNYGEGISICAPSNNVHKYWRLQLPGLGVSTTTGSQPLWTSSFGGTSSATPPGSRNCCPGDFS